MRDFLWAAIGLAVLSGALLGQRPKFESFEVATIKPADPDVPGRYIKMQSAHRFYARNHTVKTLIEAAYNITSRAVSGGPAWVESDRYEIVAVTPNDPRPTPDEQMAMLRQLLADRFHLSFHREPKEFSVYAITVAKGGPKLKATTVDPDATPDGPPLLAFVLSPAVVRLPAKYTTIAEMASVMQRAVFDRPVIDRTGLAGRYDFDLEFTPDESMFGGLGLKGTAESTKPDLFSALQEQLGLKLEASRGIIDTVVIDRVDRPTDN
jgi:uncharacterized protein (TIGR03435 family)